MSAASRWLRSTGALPPLGFAARLGLATSVLMTVVCVAQSWILARSDLEHLRRHLAERGYTISQYLAREAASTLVAGHVEGLHQLAEQAQAPSRIVYSRFFDSHGLLLASMGKPPGTVAPLPAAGREPSGPIPVRGEIWEVQAAVLPADGEAGDPRA